MSLQVWLPLNGNLNNQGLSDVTVTNNGATVDSNGKIGSCYSCGAMYANDFTLNTEEFSVCYWVKYVWIGAYNSYVVSLNNSTSTDYQFMIGSLGNGTDNSATSTYLRLNASFSGTIPIPVGEWHHCCATWKGTTVSLYVDGVFDRKITGVTVNPGATHLGINCRSNSTSGSGVSSTGSSGIYLNDVRIYDHCLSAKEVKEISKGLICHYKLGNNGFGNPNLLVTQSPSSFSRQGNKYVNTAADTRTNDTFNLQYYKGSTYVTTFFTKDVSTTPCDVKTTFTVPENVTGIRVKFNGESRDLELFRPARAPVVAGETYTLSIRVLSSKSEVVGGVQVESPKLEKGSTATPWCPHESDELYYQLGICGKNLLPNSTLDRDGWENPSGSAILQDNGYYKVTFSGSSGWWGSRYAVNLEAGKTYVASCKGYGTKTQMWFWKDGTNNLSGNINTTSTPQFLYVKYTPAVSGSYYIVCYAGPNNVNYYKDVRFYECNEEIDHSGYSNNGVGIGSILPSEPRGRYSTSTYCNSTNVGANSPTGAAYIRCALTSPIKDATALTINWWGNVEEYGYQTSGILSLSNISSLPSDYETSALAQYDSAFKFNLTDGGYSSISSEALIERGNWHMYTLVFNNGAVQGYRDGVSIVSSSKSGTLAQFAYVYMGINAAGGATRKTKSKWSDFRIYSTALSASDVKELYSTSASIDKNGNMYAYEFKEE